MRGILLAYSVGIMLASFVTEPRVALWWCGVVALLLALALWKSVRRNNQLRWFCQWALAAAIGVAWHLLWADSILRLQLPAELEGRDMWITGVVVSLPTASNGVTQFQFFIEENDADFLRRRVLLNLYGEYSLEAGQRWQLQVRLNRPHGFANPGGFDYEAWLFQQRISAKGYVRNHPDNRMTGEGSVSLQAVRNNIRRKMTAIAGDLPSAGVLLALSLGDRSRVQPAEWELMRASGTNHLFVISGLHIGLVAAVVYWLGNRCLRALPTLSLHYPRQKTALWLALVAALLYSLLAGFSLPTQRAFIMTAVFFLGQIGSRPVAVSLRFLLALAAVLTFNPLAALNAGFWLSFVAVAGLLLCLNAPLAIQQQTQLVRTVSERWLMPQLVVFLALAPFLLFWMQQVSLLSPLINVLAIPLVGMIVVPLTLLGVVLLYVSAGAALPPFLLSDYLVALLFRGIAWITSQAPWNVVDMQALSIALLLGIGAAVVMLLAPVPRTLRLLVLPLMLPLLYPKKLAIAEGAMDIHILDVGQGLSVIVQTTNHSLVYDTGAALSPEFDLGTAVVVPVLRQLGVRHVDAVVISHFDNDHAGGFEGLLTSVPVTRVIANDPGQAQQRLAAIAKSSTISASACLAGEQWQWDGIDFAFLHPLAAAVDSNNSSCVLQISSGEHSFLFPGDIERDAERSLAIRLGTDLRSDVLLAPHHGSNTSSTYAFIKRVAPRFVIYTAGYRNSFGHPTTRIRQRYAETGAQGFVTHDTGMLSFYARQHTALAPPRQFRQTHRRYWH